MPADELDPRWREMLDEVPPVRSLKVLALRDAIASGGYDTDAKLDAALDRLFEEL